jgi:hypothetical protein
MHGGAWYVKPTKNLTVASPPTPTWATGTPDSDFPLANVLTLEPDVVAKANENTATLRFTFGASKTIVGFLFINLSFPGVTMTVTNNGGMATQNVPVPAPKDNLMVNAFIDLTGVPSNSAAQWNFAVAGTAPVTFGHVVAIEEWSEFRMRWSYVLTPVFPVIEHRTSYKKRLQYWIPTRYRKFKGMPFYAEDRNSIRGLREEAHGSITPWGFVSDMNDTSASMLVQFGPHENEETYEFFDGDFDDDSVRGVVEMPIELEEAHGGISLL